MANTNSVPMAAFGPGSLFVTRTDTAGAPFNIGYAQEFSYDESADNKELYGTNQYALLVARGTVKATGKIKAATISGLALAQCFWGQSFSSGQYLSSLSEAVTVAATTTGATGMGINVTHQSSANKDLGVSYTTSVPAGLPLTLAASTTASLTAGQYYVSSTGLYTFSTLAQDLGAALKANYAYVDLTAGQQITVTNQPIGTTPTFQLDYVTTLYGATMYRRFYSCISTKLALAHKLTDFAMPEIDIAFFANSAGNVFTVTQTTVA